MRRCPAACIAVAIAFAATAGACTSQPQSGGWEHEDDRGRPRVSETSECHDEARRRAEIRYPDPPRETAGRTWPQYNNDRRFPAEVGFFNECMRRKGFVPAR